MATLHACVLAAGKGTRMGGDRPKVLFEAGGKPLLEWVTNALSDAGARHIVAVVGHKKDDVIAMLSTGVRWAEQSPQLGTGHAVRCARLSFPGDMTGSFLVTCGDMPLIRAETYRELADIQGRENVDAVLLTVPIDADSRFGRIVRDDSGNVVRIVEYKDATPEERNIREGNAGVYCFRAESFWPALEGLRNDNAQGEYYLTDVIAILIRDGGTVRAVRSTHPGEELGVNTPDDLRLADEALRRR
ncbi:MAG: NTP transferase domain-containing protein [Planctomycetes bacterium]|nr:NTP transferase domain-containing protein [Planctomycetota bacterium]